MSGHLVGDTINSGALGVVTVTTTNPIPAGKVVMGFMWVGSAALSFASVTDNSGLGNVWTIVNVRNGTVGMDGVFFYGVSNGTIPTGTVFTGTLVSGTPGGRMGSVAYFDDTFRAPVPTIDVNSVTGVSGSSNPIASAGPTDSPELCIFGIGMSSVTAGGAADSITLDGSLTQLANHNHTGSVTRYYAWGYRYLANANPINDSATLQALDSSMLGYFTFKLPVPPPPGGSRGNLLILKLT
jgi:hypothetical protein